MDILQIRKILKEQYRNANNTKESSTKSEIKETKESSFFGPSESALSQRVIEQTKALMPELIDILEKKKKKKNNDHEKPTKATKSSSMDLKPDCAKKVKDSRDYSFLLSETAEIPKILKGSPPNPSNLKSIPKAGSNVNAKKSPDNKFKANPKGSQKTPGNLRPKMSSLKEKEGGDNKYKASSAKSKSESLSVSKDSVPVTASKSLKSRPSENLVTESVQSSSAKQNLNLKQAKPRNTKVMPKKEGPCLKKEKEIKKGRVEEDLGDDENVDVSSLIHEIMGRRGKRRYRDYDDDDDGDDRSMVSGFNDILKEERKSEKIARKEDEEERLRIEQEEKSERLRKAKKQKLMN